MTLLNDKSLPLVLVLAGSVGLAACSSKPAPWAESSSPWDNRAEESGVQPVVMDEPGVEALEPIDIAPGDGMMGLEEDIMPMDAQAEMLEPVMEEPPVAAPVMVSGNLAQQPANYYTVQVVASSSMGQLKDFARRNQLSDEWVAETSVNGKVWYVLMLGVYPSKTEAEQALASVQGLETQPWVRTVGSVQSVMMN